MKKLLNNLQMTFGNGRLEEFLLDQSITAQQMRTHPIAVCVAAALAVFNFTQLSRFPAPHNKQPICWDRMRCWVRTMRQHYTQEELKAEGLDNLDTMVGLLSPGSNLEATHLQAKWLPASRSGVWNEENWAWPLLSSPVTSHPGINLSL